MYENQWNVDHNRYMEAPMTALQIVEDLSAIVLIGAMGWVFLVLLYCL